MHSARVGGPSNAGRGGRRRRRIAALLVGVLLPTFVGVLVPTSAGAIGMEDLLGSWHVLVHYKDSGSDHPDRERWVDRVWKFEREGDRILWTDYPIVVFDDETGRFERLGTNRQSRVLHFWEPNESQIENVQSGLEVNQRGAKSKTLRLDDEGVWTSATRARPESMNFISYVENWSIAGLPDAPVFERSDSLSSGMTETLEGTARYTTTAVGPDGLLLSGRFERDGTQEGTFRMMRSGGTQWVKGSGKSPNERFREMALSQYRLGPEDTADLRADLDQAFGEAGLSLPDAELERLSQRIVALAAAGKNERQIQEILEVELVESFYDFAPEDANHDDSARYVLPFAAAAPRRLIQGNAGKLSHYGRQQYAFDFDLPVGETVVAARAGEVVVVVDEFTRGGPVKSLRSKANVVVVRHEDGSFASYVHLSPGAAVEVGDRVEPGQPLGQSGNTGFTTRPHLHFSVSVLDDGKPRTVPIRFAGKGAAGFVPVEGAYYGGPGWKSD